MRSGGHMDLSGHVKTGNIELDVAALKKGGKSIEARELQQERQRYEEQEDVIRSELAAGFITEDEARKRLARGKMHHKVDEDSSHHKIDESAAAGANYMTTQQLLEEVLDTEDKVVMVR